MLLTLVVCGVAALAGGFIDAIAGGGGLLTVPALLVCGVPPHVALGTNKISAFLGTVVSLINFAVNGLVRWRIAVCGVAFSLLGSWLGALLVSRVDSSALGRIIVFFLPFAMIATLIPSRGKNAEDRPIAGVKFWLLLPLVALLLGFYDGFFGPGTGTFLILALHWVIGLGLVGATATAKSLNLASNFSGAVSFIWFGMVNWELGLTMAVCLMLGNWAGSAFAIRIGEKAVRRFLLVSLGLLMGSLIYEYFLK